MTQIKSWQTVLLPVAYPDNNKQCLRAVFENKRAKQDTKYNAIDKRQANKVDT